MPIPAPFLRRAAGFLFAAAFATVAVAQAPQPPEVAAKSYLVVDLTKPYAEHGSYLEIELARLRGQDHQTCGGRALNDDVMDTIFTQMINAGNGPVIRDGVDHASRPAGRTFPYLAEPNLDPPRLPAHH